MQHIDKDIINSSVRNVNIGDKDTCIIIKDNFLIGWIKFGQICTENLSTILLSDIHGTYILTLNLQLKALSIRHTKMYSLHTLWSFLCLIILFLCPIYIFFIVSNVLLELLSRVIWSLTIIFTWKDGESRSKDRCLK